MGNCLVTKLKGVVSNDNIRKMNEIVFSVKEATNARVLLSGMSGTTTARCVGDCYFNDNVGLKEITFTDTTYTLSVYGTGNVYVNTRYNMNYIDTKNSSFTFNIEDFYYLPENQYHIALVFSSATNDVLSKTNIVYGDISKLPMDLQAYCGEGIDMYGNMDEHISGGLLTRLDTSGEVEFNTSLLENKNITISSYPAGAHGPVEYMADSYTTSRYIYASKPIPGITGSIESFVSRVRSLGKTEDFVLLRASGRMFPNVTFNGNPISELLSSSDVGNIVFRWTANDITYTVS